MALRLLRAAYGIEFLIALVATLDFWAQVGGQGHLDLMAWWWKFSLSIATAAVVVKLTAVSARPAGWRTLASFGWLMAVIGLMALGAAVTYYYHLHETVRRTRSGPGANHELWHPSQRSVPSERARDTHLMRAAAELKNQCPVVPAGCPYRYRIRLKR